MDLLKLINFMDLFTRLWMNEGKNTLNQIIVAKVELQPKLGELVNDDQMNYLTRPALIKLLNDTCSAATMNRRYSKADFTKVTKNQVLRAPPEPTSLRIIANTPAPAPARGPGSNVASNQRQRVPQRLDLGKTVTSGSRGSGTFVPTDLLDKQIDNVIRNLYREITYSDKALESTEIVLIKKQFINYIKEYALLSSK
jgi:hypothetical protein